MRPPRCTAAPPRRRAPSTKRRGESFGDRLNIALVHVPNGAAGCALQNSLDLLFGSRSQQRLYACDVSTGAVTEFGGKLDDVPECVLVVHV